MSPAEELRTAGPEPYYADDSVTLYLGDCRKVLVGLPEASIDAVVCDPPYELEFMGRDWDASGVAFDPATWRECLRLLKPGGHLVAFGGTRTYHRMTVAIEDAGFEIRDSLHWIYGSGFPKSLDVSKAIDKTKRRDYVIAAVELGLDVPGNNLHDWTKAEHSPGDAWWERFKAHLSPDDWGRIEREVLGPLAHARGVKTSTSALGGSWQDAPVLTAPATDEAKRWEGFGTALKPGHEPIVLARKPLTRTVAANVLEYGTGALNIAATRVGSGGQCRWPTNLVLTHSATCLEGGPCVDDCPAGELDSQGSGASRYFPTFRYEAKASSAERPRLDDGTAHSTVKPLTLMRWLVRLATPPGGTVLDMFAGSGTTGEACVIEGFRCVMAEREQPHAELIKARLSKPLQPSLFGGVVA